MADSDYKYFESGVTGWVEITSPIIPNPNAVPIEVPLKSTQQRKELADGGLGYVIPETKFTEDPVKFTWQFQSGDVFQHRFKEIAENNTFFRIQSNVRERIYTGKIINYNQRVLLWGADDRQDVTLTIQPQSDG